MPEGPDAMGTAAAAPLLELRGLRVTFPGRRGRSPPVRAVDGVDLQVQPGEVLGLVGESGCGKTTTGKAVLRLLDPTGGEIRLRGQDIAKLPQSSLLPFRRRMQFVFQDPAGSLNPRRRVGAALAAPFVIHGLARGSELADRVEALLRMVELPADAAQRYPHEFSGGQRQRIGIARALALGPELLIGDEPFAALDVLVQAQIIGLLDRLRQERGLTYVLISHNLAVVSQICGRVAVMYLGRIVEAGPRDAVFFDTRHPYTQALLAAVPQLEPGRVRPPSVRGDLPSPADPPPGCHFHTRCPRAMPVCAREYPAMRSFGAGHLAACHLYPG